MQLHHHYRPRHHHRRKLIMRTILDGELRGSFIFIIFYNSSETTTNSIQHQSCWQKKVILIQTHLLRNNRREIWQWASFCTEKIDVYCCHCVVSPTLARINAKIFISYKIMSPQASQKSWMACSFIKFSYSS